MAAHFLCDQSGPTPVQLKLVDPKKPSWRKVRICTPTETVSANILRPSTYLCRYFSRLQH